MGGTNEKQNLPSGHSKGLPLYTCVSYLLVIIKYEYIPTYTGIFISKLVNKYSINQSINQSAP